MEPMKPMEPMRPMEPMKPMEPMRPMKPMVFEQWWPKELGNPSTAGAQNGMRYAFFPEARKLLIDRNGQRTTYDTGDNRISGVSSQQSGGAQGSILFSSQHGAVRLEDLHAEEASHAEPRGSAQAGSSQAQHQGGGVQRQAQSSSQGQSQGTQSTGERWHGSSREPGHAGDQRGALPRDKHEPGPMRRADLPGAAPSASGERVVFSEEGATSAYIKLVAKGDIDIDMIEALEDFVRRQKRRLSRD